MKSNQVRKEEKMSNNKKQCNIHTKSNELNMLNKNGALEE